MMYMLLGILSAFAEPYIAVLQSDSFVEYQTPTTSFLKNCTIKTKAYDIHGDKDLGLKRIAELKKNKPKAIFAVGAKAAWIAQKELPNIPLVYTMVQDPEKFGLRSSKNIEIKMHPPKDLAVSQLQLFFPSIQHIAVFGSEIPTKEIKEYTKVMEDFGIKTTLFQSSDTRALRKILTKLPDDIDAIWLPTDPTWLTPEKFYHINNTGIKKSIPTLSNSTYLAQAGAMLSVSSNHESIGILGAEIMNQLLQGNESLHEQTHFTQETFVTLNRETQKSIGLEFEPFMFDFIHQQIEK
ncbi:MAG: hypothetical protein CL916_08245 [Deltaproteobacteria bacterium]|nr:hypothetical protein [Deltaproteobacteria bacterium]